MFRHKEVGVHQRMSTSPGSQLRVGPPKTTYSIRPPRVQRMVFKLQKTFRLTDAWLTGSGNRKVFKFRLEFTQTKSQDLKTLPVEVPRNRLIPSNVKLEVWQRDRGQCVLCGKKDNLHFDHDIPYSKGGSSILAGNIRLLCARHNLTKKDRIE